MSRKKLYLCIWIGILFVAATLRFYRLGDVPVGVTNDELGYISNAYSISQAGRNVFGEFLPFFTYFGHGFPYMPVPMYLQAMVFRVMPLSAFSGRFLNALLGTGSILLVGWVVRKISGKESLAYAAALALAISPWHIFFSRTGYDTVVASFFYLLFFALSIRFINNRRFSLWPMLILLLALFSYRGMTPLAFGLVVILTWYALRSVQKNKKYLISFLVSCFVAFSLFGVVAKMESPRGFMAEAGIDISSMEKNIEYSMRESQGLHTVKRIFLNKPIAVLSRWLGQYMGGYDGGMLFLHGEGSQSYSMWMRGKLYAVDAIFFLIGLLFLFKTPSLFTFGLISLGLFFVSGLPGLVGGPPYGSRNFFLTFPVAFFIGSGWVASLQSKKTRVAMITIVILLYGYSVSHFVFDYFERYANQRSEVWFGSMKAVSAIIEREKANTDIIWAGVYFPDFLQYSFYTSLDPRQVQMVWQTRSETPNIQTYRWNKLTVNSLCTPESLAVNAENIQQPLFIVRDGCWKDMVGEEIIRDFYRNPLWHVMQIDTVKSAATQGKLQSVSIPVHKL